MKKKKFKYWIVTDENLRPMAWSGDQLCYCTSQDWEDDHFPVRPYTLRTAKKNIRLSTEYRENNNYSPVKYKLMPVTFNNINP